ncbi:bifunctional metallophosphatase/5'-nucleotidase [Leuconostoc fallax]|uniref:Calcineurin-like phosphoesterase domain-containing protein n=1 Tax=Leuconostoc fallax TaxID=1251 RepID=A0A4R5N8U1_9LACO|nr:bifunctional UDP-sugar hydrolase/5'-nucleotidase [Leuconostoc fallax]MBU7455881.1 bifunctional metallophosphatase/5'-nucleotidase [Leuconostoc fallax]TDG67924.1 hypothetical protein C5L23_000230 [Leuconostoc fallax]
MEMIHLLHTNDVHSHFENWPRITRFLSQKRAAYQKSGDEVLTLDIGDFIDRLHPLTDATLGKFNVDLLNQAHYDAVTIGNNEGLVLSHDDLSHLYDDAKFPVLLANLKELSTMQHPDWTRPYHIFTTQQQTKIAIIGLTAPYDLTYPSLGWQPLAVEPVLDQLLPSIQAQADVTILLSHLGLPTDKKIAQKYPIDVILGAHTHHLLETGEYVNGTLLAAAGRYGENIGEVHLTLENGVVKAQSARTTPTYSLSENDTDHQVIRHWLLEGERRLKRYHVAQLHRDITPDEQAYDAMQALEHYLDVPAAMVSTGLFMDTFPAGELDAYGLLESMPHAINPMKITLSGQQLLNLVHGIQEQTAYLSNLPVKGSGFRGKIFGYMRFNGIDVHRDGKVYYAGERIDLAAHYQLATVDHYKWLPFFPVIQQAPANIHLEILLRELMAKYYRHRYPEKTTYGS